jgi:hypothetical protein
VTPRPLDLVSIFSTLGPLYVLAGLVLLPAARLMRGSCIPNTKVREPVFKARMYAPVEMQT